MTFLYQICEIKIISDSFSLALLRLFQDEMTVIILYCRDSSKYIKVEYLIFIKFIHITPILTTLCHQQHDLSSEQRFLEQLESIQGSSIEQKCFQGITKNLMRYQFGSDQHFCSENITKKSVTNSATDWSILNHYEHNLFCNLRIEVCFESLEINI